MLPFHTMHDQVTSHTQVTKQKALKGILTISVIDINIRPSVFEEIPSKADYRVV
jgi:hypothetical protein